MATRIAVAGATGNLGKRTVKALHAQGADAVALARKGVAEDKVRELQSFGAKVAIVDMSSASDVSKACAGVACMVSALQGLREVIVDTQSVLLDAAIDAGVPRFIPSDYSADFTNLPRGENRNFDLRREFHERLDVARIQSTAIFNGAFAEILTYNIPLLDYEKKWSVTGRIRIGASTSRPWMTLPHSPQPQLSMPALPKPYASPAFACPPTNL